MNEHHDTIIEGKNKMGDRLRLYLDDAWKCYSVLWDGCCGCVELTCTTSEEARALYTTLLAVKEVEVD